jgi:D-galactarolactone cycloisomerase
VRILEIRAYPLEASMATPIRNSVGVIDRRRALVVELVADSGLSGWGETQEDPDGALAEIRSTFAPWMLGAHLDADLAAVLAAPQPTRRRALAASALDIAAWDLRAREAGVSIAELTGRPVLRTRVPAYASGPFLAVDGDPYATIVDEAVAHAEHGYRAIKLRSGVSPASDLEVVRRVRDRVGDQVAIMIDLNAGPSRDDATELVRASNGSALAWIEEPVASDDPAGFAELARLTDVPLAGGESLWRPEDFTALIHSGGLGVLQPDLYLCGGVSGMLRLSDEAAAAGIPLLPHVFGSHVNLAASLQVTAVLPETPSAGDTPYPWFELDQSDNPLRRIGGEPAIDADGELRIPSGPGLGVAFDPADFDAFSTQRKELTP